MRKKVVELSHRYGGDLHWIIRGGGNVSIKDDASMWIKASGSNLRTLHPDGFVRMEREKLDAIWTKEYPAEVEEREAEAKRDLLNARAPGQDEKRPSVETMMHALFPHVVVFHSHPTLVNALGCADGGQAVARELFGDELLWIPTINPGIVLSKQMYSEIAGYRRERAGAYPLLIVLENHGLVVFGDTAEAIEEKHRVIAERIRATLSRPLREAYDSWPTDEPAVLAAYALEPERSAGAPATGGDAKSFDRSRTQRVGEIVRSALRDGPEREPAVLADRSKLFDQFLVDKTKFAPLDGAYTPDHIVYAGHRPAWAESVDSVAATIAAYRSEEGCDPKILAARGIGVFAIGSSRTKAEAALLLAHDAAKLALLTEAFGGVRFMPPHEVSFIRNWEVEQFRAEVGEGKKT